MKGRPNSVSNDISVDKHIVNIGVPRLYSNGIPYLFICVSYTSPYIPPMLKISYCEHFRLVDSNMILGSFYLMAWWYCIYPMLKKPLESSKNDNVEFLSLSDPYQIGKNIYGILWDNLKMYYIYISVQTFSWRMYYSYSRFWLLQFLCLINKFIVFIWILFGSYCMYPHYYVLLFGCNALI